MFCAYTKYYFVPWPESQDILERDENLEHTLGTDIPGVMAECEWYDNLNERDKDDD